MPLTKNATFRQLATFHAVARLGSVSAAADELHLTQPAVSQQVRDLEVLGLVLERGACVAAEEALRNAKGELDIAKAQSELAVMAAQIAALRKYRQKK